MHSEEMLCLSKVFTVDANELHANASTMPTATPCTTAKAIATRAEAGGPLTEPISPRCSLSTAMFRPNGVNAHVNISRYVLLHTERAAAAHTMYLLCSRLQARVRMC